METKFLSIKNVFLYRKFSCQYLAESFSGIGWEKIISDSKFHCFSRSSDVHLIVKIDQFDSRLNLKKVIIPYTIPENIDISHGANCVHESSVLSPGMDKLCTEVKG